MIVYLNEINELTKNKRSIVRKITTFYEHMLKWKYWEDVNQENGWPNTIFNAMVDIYDISKNTNAYNHGNNNTRSCYINATKIVKNKTNIDVLFKDDGDLYKVFSNIDDILNFEKVKDWMLEEARTDSKKESVRAGYNIHKIKIKK